MCKNKNHNAKNTTQTRFVRTETNVKDPMHTEVTIGFLYRAHALLQCSKAYHLEQHHYKHQYYTVYERGFENRTSEVCTTN